MSCPTCNKTVEIDGLCHRCHNRLHRQLDDLLDYWQSAHKELLPGRSGDGGRSAERTIGLNVNALSFIAGDDILGMLHEWEKIIREDRNLTRPAFLKKLPLDQEIKTAITFAQRHLQWSGEQPWIEDFANELKELHAKGKVAAKDFTHKVRKIPCPSTLPDGEYCDFRLKALDDPLEIFECPKCAAEWTTLRLVAVALSTPGKEVWLDAEAIAEWLKVKSSAVQKFAKRNAITRRGMLYDFKAFMEARKERLI